MIKINFHCENLKDARDYIKSMWFCSKREGFFFSIDKFCYDCPKYKRMLKEVEDMLSESEE